MAMQIVAAPPGTWGRISNESYKILLFAVNPDSAKPWPTLAYICKDNEPNVWVAADSLLIHQS